MKIPSFENRKPVDQYPAMVAESIKDIFKNGITPINPRHTNYTEPEIDIRENSLHINVYGEIQQPDQTRNIEGLRKEDYEYLAGKLKENKQFSALNTHIGVDFQDSIDDEYGGKTYSLIVELPEV